jgi:ankyrin repeat protein
VYHNRIDVIQLLFSFGANLLMSDNAGRTPSFYSGAKVQPLCDVNIKQALADESPLRTLLREQEKAVRTQQTLTLQRNRRCVKAGEDTRDVRPTTLASEYFHDDKRSLCCNLSELMVTLALERAALHALVKREKLDVPVKDTVAEAIRVAARTDDVLKLRSIWDENSDRAGWEETLAAAEPGHRMTAVHFAVRDNCLHALRFFLGSDMPIFAKDLKGATPLHIAAINGHKESTQLLLTHARQLYGADNQAALAGILDAGYHPNQSSALTPLHYAAEGNFLAVVRLLLEAGANPHKRDGTGKLPVDRAASTEIRKTLVSGRRTSMAPPPRPPPVGPSATSPAFMSIDELKDAAPGPPPPPAARHVDVDASKYESDDDSLFSSDESWSDDGSHENQHHPHSHSHSHSHRVGVEESKDDHDFVTPKPPRRKSVVTYSSNTKVAPKTEEAKKRTSLSNKMMSVSRGNIYTETNAAPLRIQLDGRTHKVSDLIHDAALQGRDDDLLAILKLARGATGDSLSASGTHLDNSGHSASGHTVAAVDDQDDWGRTALMLATQRGYMKCLQHLLNIGDANVNMSDHSGASALIIAAKFNRSAVIRLLLDRGAVVDATDNLGNTALHYACEKNFKESCMVLLDGGCSATITNKKGWTADMGSRYASAKRLIQQTKVRRGW